MVAVKHLAELQQVQVAQVAAVQVAQALQMVLLVLQIQAVGVGLVALADRLVAQAVQELSSFPTLAHNVVQAAQSHQAVATLFTHLQLAVLIRHDYARAPERAF